MKIRILSLLAVCGVLWCICPATLRADFSDNFDSGPSALWGNEVGNWNAAGGVYGASNPSSFPNAYSSLPFDLTDFVVELDINNVADGGIWFRSSAAPATAIGRTGVLLVTGAGGGTLYWHDVTNPATYGSSLNATAPLFTVGVSDPHLRIEVTGDTYSVFVDGSTTAATTLTTTNFASGQVALYDNSAQTVDNFVVTPEPSSFAFLGFGAAISLFSRRRSK